MTSESYQQHLIAVSKLQEVVQREREISERDRAFASMVKRELEDTSALLHQKQLEVNRLTRLLEDRDNEIKKYREELRLAKIDDLALQILTDKNTALAKNLSSQRSQLETLTIELQKSRAENEQLSSIHRAEMDKCASENIALRRLLRAKENLKMLQNFRFTKLVASYQEH